MKKKICNCFLLLILITIISTLSGCKETEITDVNVEFWMSIDNGETYSTVIFEFPEPGNPICLKLRIQIQTNKKKEIFPQVTLFISNSEHVEAHILGGPSIMPRLLLSTYTIYDFTARGVKDNDQFTEVYVEFIPYEEEKIEIYVEFDDSVPDAYSRKGTLILYPRTPIVETYVR